MRKSLEIALNIGTAGAVALAAYVLTTERIMPALKELAVIRVGDAVEEPIKVVEFGSDSTVSIPGGRPVVLSVFRSTCAACTRAAPGWLDLRRAIPGDTDFIAIALEEGPSALEYAGRHLPGTRVATPLATDDFITRFDIRAVPTTLVIDAEGELRAHDTGPLQPSDIRRLADLVR